jgi:hypothetical protein
MVPELLGGLTGISTTALTGVAPRTSNMTQLRHPIPDSISAVGFSLGT